MALEADLNQYLAHLRVERGLSENTIAAYRRDLTAFLLSGEEHGSLPSEIELTAHLANLRRLGLAESSIARACVSVRNFSAFLAKEQRTLDPLAEFKTPKIPIRLPKALSVDQVQALINATIRVDGIGALRDLAIVEFLYSSGARVSELIALNVDDIHDSEDRFTLRVRGKGGKDRYIPLGSYAKRAISDYLVRERPALVKTVNERALFLNHHGRRLSRQSAWQIIHDSAERANIGEVVSPHSLRHSFATHLLDGGADIRVVQELLGHANVTTTQIYTLVTIDKLRESYRSAHPRAK